MSERTSFPAGRWKIILVGILLIAIGAAIGSITARAFGPRIEMAPSQPVAINTLASNNGIVTIRARVAEVYGNKFVATDASGRTLVELGRGGEDAALVATGQTVTVQGRYVRGVLRASFLVDASNIVHPLGHGWMGRHGGEGRHGPRGPRGEGPPPVSTADPVVATPLPAGNGSASGKE